MMGVLSRLVDLIFPPRPNEALVRATSLEGVGKLVEPLLTASGAVALLPYRTRLVQALVIEAKFKDGRRAQELLGRVLADYLKESCQDRMAFSLDIPVLIPVPLSSVRKRDRGYNQVERIIRAALATLEPDMLEIDTGLLIRTRDTASQTTLTAAARVSNMSGAFSVLRAPDPGRTYIVIDDVTTTGATLREAASALQLAGALDVQTLALAH